MSLLEHPDRPGLARRRRGLRRRRRRLAAAPGRLPAPLPAPLLPRGAAQSWPAWSSQGKLSNLERKTSEPIAYQAGRHRKPVQHFVGAGCWDDEAVMAELRRHVGRGAGRPRRRAGPGPQRLPQEGAASCGVARQWCGRLGKVDNCQVGVFLAYVSGRRLRPGGPAAVPARGLGRGRQAPPGDPRARGGGLPGELADRPGPARPLRGPDLPFGWVAGDDEFGRAADFRAAVAAAAACATCWTCRATRSIRDLGEAPARGPAAAAVAAGGRVGQGPAVAALAAGWRSGTGRKGRRWCGRWRRGCRPRTRTAGSGRRSGWWSSARSTGSRRCGTRCPTPAAEPLAGGGAGPRPAARGRGVVPGGQGGGGPGALRGAELGGLAPPHDAVAVGAVVSDPGEAGGGEKKPRR